MLIPKSSSLADHAGVLSDYFERPLRSIANRAMTVWFNRDRLDRVLEEVLVACDDCELVYAIDVGGRQMSSNVQPGGADRSAYWQDLSQRPIAVPLRVLSDDNFRGAFVCDAYISQVTRRPCATLMYGVRSEASLLGFIAADFDPDTLALRTA